VLSSILRNCAVLYLKLLISCHGVIVLPVVGPL